MMHAFNPLDQQWLENTFRRMLFFFTVFIFFSTTSRFFSAEQNFPGVRLIDMKMIHLAQQLTLLE